MRQATVGEQVVIDGASKLGRALGASRAFRDYEQAFEQYQSDPSAAELLEKVRRVQQEGSTQEMLWGDSGDWAERLASLQQQVRAHPVIRALQQTETELAALLFGTALKLGQMTGIEYAEACTGRSLAGCGPSRGSEEFAVALRSAPEVSSALEALGGAIGETDAYRKFEVAMTAFQNNTEVIDLRKRVRSVVGAYVEAQQNGKVDLGLIQNVRAAQNQLRDHPVVQEFSRRRQDAHGVFQAVNQAISEILGIDVAQAVAPASGCCG
jgi:cell fate (sporulation/competence/biofilm development) regulator YlbF (YheA/YmcA/DUF963 family)